MNNSQKKNKIIIAVIAVTAILTAAGIFAVRQLNKADTTTEAYTETTQESTSDSLTTEESEKTTAAVETSSEFYAADKNDFEKFKEAFCSETIFDSCVNYDFEKATSKEITLHYFWEGGVDLTLYKKYYGDVVNVNEGISDYPCFRVPVKSYNAFCKEVFNVKNPEKLRESDFVSDETLKDLHMKKGDYISEKDGYYYFGGNTTGEIVYYKGFISQHKKTDDGRYLIYADEYIFGGDDSDNADYGRYVGSVKYTAALKKINGKKMWSIYNVEVTNEAKEYVATDALNIRSGPGTEYNKVGLINKGDYIYVIKIKNGWARIGKDRYVCADYIKKEK